MTAFYRNSLLCCLLALLTFTTSISERSEVEASPRSNHSRQRVTNFHRHHSQFNSQTLNILKDAIRKGDLSSLQIIKEDYLEKQPDYHELLLPELKHTALRALLVRFSLQDWEGWSREDTGPKSLAKRFSDDVFEVNTEIGVFLETSAQLFHRLYLRTEVGEVFDSKVELADLFSNAERLLSSKATPNIPASYLLSSRVLDNPWLRFALEEKQCQFVSEYLSSRSQIQNDASLLRSISAKACNEKALSRLGELLKGLAIEPKSPLRRAYLDNPDLLSALESLAVSDSEIRGALGNFYVLSAVDMLAESEMEQAEIYLNRSAKLVPELGSRQVVQTFIEEKDDLRLQKWQERGIDTQAEEDLVGETEKSEYLDTSAYEEDFEEEFDTEAYEYYDEEGNLLAEPGSSSWIFKAMIWILLLTFLFSLLLLLVKRAASSRGKLTKGHPRDFEDEGFWSKSEQRVDEMQDEILQEINNS